MGCPKCGEKSQEDSLECSGCGIIFSKFNKGTVKPKLAKSKSRISITISIYLFIAVVIIGVPVAGYIFYSETTDEGQLKKVWSEYDELMQSANHISGYDYLSSLTQEKWTKGEWNVHLISMNNDPRYHSEIALITMRGDRTAIISLNTIDSTSGETISKGIQTWEKEGNSWKRAWFKDYGIIPSN